MIIIISIVEIEENFRKRLFAHSIFRKELKDELLDCSLIVDNPIQHSSDKKKLVATRVNSI